MMANTRLSARASIRIQCFNSDHIASAVKQAFHRIPSKRLSVPMNVPSVQIAWKTNSRISAPIAVEILNADPPVWKTGQLTPQAKRPGHN